MCMHMHVDRPLMDLHNSAMEFQMHCLTYKKKFYCSNNGLQCKEPQSMAAQVQDV